MIMLLFLEFNVTELKCIKIKFYFIILLIFILSMNNVYIEGRNNMYIIVYIIYIRIFHKT